MRGDRDRVELVQHHRFGAAQVPASVPTVTTPKRDFKFAAVKPAA